MCYTNPPYGVTSGGFGQTVQPVIHTVQPDDASNHCKPSLWEGVDNSTQIIIITTFCKSKKAFKMLLIENAQVELNCPT